MTKSKITYESSGVDYKALDTVKKIAQEKAGGTSDNLHTHAFSEIADSRGESAYVFTNGKTHMASVVEGLGTKNLVADAMRTPRKTYYDVIGHDTVATVINDLISVGATPLVIHAYWAVGDSSFLTDTKRMSDLIDGWKSACDLSSVSWGGGETPTLKDIVSDQTIELGGAAFGIIPSKKQILSDARIKEGDRIILLQSNGVNANGISLIRNLAKILPNGYRTTLSDGRILGEAVLTKTHIYAGLITDLLSKQIDLHYISNITGHGLRKIMRGKPSFTYRLDTIFEPPLLFKFIQEHAGLTDEDMYGTFNMGQDYAVFLPETDVEKTLQIITSHGYKGIHAGVVEKGRKQVILEPAGVTFSEKSLNLRS